jgi:hypothetical protein
VAWDVFSRNLHVYLHFGVVVTLIYGMFQDMGHAVFVLLKCIVTCVWVFLIWCVLCIVSLTEFVSNKDRGVLGT